MAVALLPSLRSVVGSVPEQLRLLLTDLRRQGLMFEQAWEEAWATIDWPESQRETTEWARALDGTKATWRARYEGWDHDANELGVVGLMEVTDRLR